MSHWSLHIPFQVCSICNFPHLSWYRCHSFHCQKPWSTLDSCLSHPTSDSLANHLILLLKYNANPTCSFYLHCYQPSAAHWDDLRSDFLGAPLPCDFFNLVARRIWHSNHQSDHITLRLTTFLWLPLHSQRLKAEVLKTTCNGDKSLSLMPSAPIFLHSSARATGPLGGSVGKPGPVSMPPRRESTPPGHRDRF